MISRRSSGSKRAASAVEPTRSQNMTVSCRRSAPPGWGAGIGLTGAAAVSPIGSPQPPQNLAEGSFSKPQVEHENGSAAPHWAQKRLIAAFSALQFWQRTAAEPVLGPRYARTRGQPPQCEESLLCHQRPPSC